MKKYALLTLLFCYEARAQNNFVQFYSNPLLSNPANTGRFNRNFRIAGGVRSEINAVSAYNQSTISADSKILNSLVPENDCFAIGISALNERSIGEGIKNDYLSVSLAYQKGLDYDGEQQIGVGFQTTFGHKRIEHFPYVFENQLNFWINNGFYNIDFQQLTNVDFSYFDLNVGVVYQGKINPANFFSVSATLHHANRPNELVQGGKFILKRQYGGHIAWENRPSEQKKIYSFIKFSLQKKNEDFLGGIIYQSNISSKNYELNFGGSFRKSYMNGEFLIPVVGFRFWQLVLNMSYDINVSVKNTGRKGASEITLFYTTASTRQKFLENKFILY